MNKNLFIALLILTYCLSFAQVQWQDSGVPVRQGENIDWSQTSVACDDNTFVSVWTDTRDGTRGIYAQKVDVNGNLLWSEEGLEISHDNTMQDHPIIISSNSNSVIICWKDYEFVESYSFQIRLQKIDLNGNLLWGDDGIILDYGDTNAYYPQLINHSDGGVYILWNGYPDYDIYGIRLLADGSVAIGWEMGIELLPAINNYKVYSDQSDGLILASVLYNDIYIQRVDENGNKHWGYNGTLLHNGDEYISEVDICSTTADEYYFSWRTEVTGDMDEIMTHKTDFNGNTLWGSPITISEENYISKIITICPSDSQPIITWICGYSIFSQKIDSDGNLLWGEDGIEVYESNYLHRDSVILKGDVNNCCILSWSEEINNSEQLIRIQRLNFNGDLLFGEDGLTVYETLNNYEFSSLAINDQNYYLCWLGESIDYTFLAHQIVDIDGNIYLEENGEEMFTGLSGSVEEFQLLANADNPIMIWSERGNSNNSRIYLQILNNDGSYILAEDGIPITTYSPNNQQYENAVYGVNSGTISAVWRENYQIFAQGIDTSGNYLWSDSTGIALTLPEFSSNYPKISYVNNSGIDEYYIGWEDYSDFMNPKIFGQKIINGEMQWGENGIQIAGCDDYSFNIINVIDRFYIWEQDSYMNSSLNIKLIDENGNTALGWSDEGLEIVGVVINEDMQIKQISSGLLITWYDSDEDGVFCQIVDYDGNTFWDEGGIPLISEDYIYNYDILYEDYIYIIWNDDRDDVYKNYYMQKFNNEGEALWQESGVQISSHNYNSHGKPILTSIEQDIFAVWEHSFGSSSSLIKAQLVSPNGELHYNIPGLTICHQFMDQKHQQVYVNGTNAYVSWMDSRSGEEEEDCGSTIDGLYAQKVHLEPTSANDELIEPIEILSNYPNPFNPETTISFQLNTENTEDTEINIFNIKGQKVRTLLVNLSGDEGAGQVYSVTWNGTDKNDQPVASGIYFYQLNIDDKVIASKKCLLLK